MNRDEAVRLVADHGWVVARKTKRGYLILRCACGDHQETLHKTPSNPNHFKQKGSMDDHHLFEAATVTGVFLVEIDVMLRSPRRLTDDEVTDLIETVVDHLDERSIDPSVGTRREGDDVSVTVAVTIAEEQEFDAMAVGVAATKAAFASASIGTAGVAEAHDLRSRVLPPLAA